MSVYVPPASNNGDGCSGSCQTEDDLKYAWIGNYLNAHMLSIPSHRYAYLMWFVIVGILLIGSAIYHLGIGDQTWVGAYWTKFAPKGRLIKASRKTRHTPVEVIKAKRISREAGRMTTVGEKSKPPVKPLRRYVFSLPSFGKILLVSWMVAVPVVLSMVGADYINPNVAMFDMSASWPSNTSAPVRLARRHVIQWGIGRYVPLDVNVAFYTLPYHTWWTSGGRFGLMTNALTPFVVILSLKQVPWAVMSTRLFGRYAFERMSFLHKWGGRLVFLFAAIHTVLWSVQLRLDSRNGQHVWGFIFLWPKFRWAFVAVGFLTLLTVLSIGPIRTHYYEWFYFGHIVCAIGFMVATAFHHPPLAPWMWASLAWWALERITRAFKVAYINGIGFAGRKPDVSAPSSHPPSQDTAFSSGTFPTPQYGKTNAVPYQFNRYGSYAPEPTQNESGYVPHFARATMDSTGHQTSSSATLYEPSLRSNGPGSGPTKGFASYSLEKQGSFGDGTAGVRLIPCGAGENGERHSNEEGDEASKRPSRRYGPVSELIQEYAARPMSNIQEDHRPTHKSSHGGGTDPLSSSSSSHGDDTDLGSRMYYEDVPNSSVRRNSAANETFSGDSGPASSADHYYADKGQSRAYGNGSSAGHQVFELKETFLQQSQQRSMLPMSLPAPHAPRPALPADVAAIIKPGYAFAQVLPGKTLRLTLRTPNKMSWKPGQWVYLNLPGISGWQSHPFTIASAHDAHLTYPSSRRTKATATDLEAAIVKPKGEERTMVLLIRVRKGFTLKLWEHVKKHRHRQVTAATQSEGPGSVSSSLGKITTGVHVRAIVDGAYGSTERVRWGIHSTVVLVCGGSGISFGISVLEHLCACLHEVNLSGRTLRGGKNFAVKRIRFVWVCREFSHLQWVASALRRCIEMIPPAQLQVDLYVTHINNEIAEHRLASRQRTGPQRSSSFGDPLRTEAGSSWPQTAYPHGGQETPHSGAGYATPEGGEPEAWKDAQGNVYMEPAYVGGKEGEEVHMEANEYTEFDDEDLAEPDADEMAINTSIRDEGKLRRAHTRKATLRRKFARGANKADGPLMEDDEGGSSRDKELSPRETQTMAAQSAMFDGHVQHTSFAQKKQKQQQRQYPQTVQQERRPSGVSISQNPFSKTRRPSQPEKDGAYLLSPHGALDTRASGGVSSPMSRPHTPQSFGQGGEGGSDSIAYHSAGGEWSDEGANAPFGHETYNGFATRSSAHLLAMDSVSTNLASSGKIGSGVGGVGVGGGGGAEGLDSALDLDEDEELDLRIIAELAHMGHPRLDQIIADETKYGKGRTMVASCGPGNLSNLLRRIAVKHVDPARSRRGDKRGEVNLCMESFEWGGS